MSKINLYFIILFQQKKINQEVFVEYCRKKKSQEKAKNLDFQEKLELRTEFQLSGNKSAWFLLILEKIMNTKKEMDFFLI